MWRFRFDGPGGIYPVYAQPDEEQSSQSPHATASGRRVGPRRPKTVNPPLPAASELRRSSIPPLATADGGKYCPLMPRVGQSILEPDVRERACDGTDTIMAAAGPLVKRRLALGACSRPRSGITHGGHAVHPITVALLGFMEANRYPYTELGDGYYKLHFNGKNAAYDMYVQVREDPGQIMVFTRCPVNVPELRRAAVADYINRVNYGLYLGCLEMDADDGGVRARSSGPTGPEEPAQELIQQLFDSSFYLMDDWIPGLLRVAFGSEDPRVVYESLLSTFAAPSRDGAPGLEGQDQEVQGELEPELTPIEEEIARLLASREQGPADGGPAS